MFGGWCSMSSSGGCLRRWHCPTGPCSSATGAPRKGSAVSPVLANLFMHYAFDMWMAREYPGVAFERYADDAVVHCVTERQARNLVAAIGDRMEQVGLRMHPDKTKVLYCQDGNADSTTGSLRLRSWGSLFVLVPRARSTDRRSSRSSRQSARTPRTRSAVRSAGGGCTAGSATPSPTSRDGSAPSVSSSSRLRGMARGNPRPTLPVGTSS
jgi:Reverse transcriptase (RNA-dependent DNA polymerase)